MTYTTDQIVAAQSTVVWCVVQSIAWEMHAIESIWTSRDEAMAEMHRRRASETNAATGYVVEMWRMNVPWMDEPSEEVLDV